MNKLPGEGYNNGDFSEEFSYFYDGSVRRRLHEFGQNGIMFYDIALSRLGIGKGEVVVDIGAGMGEDGKKIAWNFRPRIVFLVEPAGMYSPDFDTRYLPLVIELENEKDSEGNHLTGVELLPSAELTSTLQELNKTKSQIINPKFTYIQPLPGVAESLPAQLENRVDKITMIHSIHEFDDVFRALRETVRIMAPNGCGLLIANGDDDKLVFKDILEQAAIALNDEAPECIQYSAPSTVSSRVKYHQAEDLLREYYEQVEIIRYRDTMLIDENRLGDYEHAFNTYRKYFNPPIINDGRWNRVKQRVLTNRLRDEMARNGGVARDTIDIAAIYFSRPKK